LRWSADEDGLVQVTQLAVKDGDSTALARALGDVLLPCLAAHKFGRLILVAPSASINRLMSDLPAALSSLVVVEVCQDMMEASGEQIYAAVRDA
jgi:protein required for attachment to host cells